MKEWRKDLHPKPERMLGRDEAIARTAPWKELLRIADDQPEDVFRQECIRRMARYLDIQDPVGETGDRAQLEYERLKHAVDAAQRSFDSFVQDMTLVDNAQRTSTTNEIARVTDPGVLLNAAFRARSTRVRFEARRALWLGGMFWKYEHEVGATEDLKMALRQLELFLNAQLHISEVGRSVDVFHHVDVGSDGKVAVNNLRVPAIDGSAPERINGENKVYLAMRSMPHPTRPREHIFFTLEARPKSRFSGVAKCMRKGDHFNALRDVLGVTFTVYQKHGDELEALVDKLDELFEADPNDREVHPTRGGRKDFANAASSALFSPEKMITTWDVARVDWDDEAMRVVTRRVFDGSRVQGRLREGQRRLAGRKIPTEIQVLTLQDMAIAKIAPTDAHHNVYEGKRVQRPMEGDEEGASLLERFLPREIYGISWQDPVIVQALKDKRLASVGLTKRILDALEASDPDMQK